jgi:hypothetical protein
MRTLKNFLKRNNKKMVEASGGARQVSIPLDDFGNSAAERDIDLKLKLSKLDFKAQELLNELKEGAPEIAFLRKVAGLLKMGSNDRLSLVAKKTNLMEHYKVALDLAALNARSEDFLDSASANILRLVEELCKFCDPDFSSYQEACVAAVEKRISLQSQARSSLFSAPTRKNLESGHTGNAMASDSDDGLDDFDADSASAASAPGR